MLHMKYLQQSNDLLRHLPTASFVSIDEEMTGISMPNSPRPPKDHTPAQRYEFLKKIPEQFSIIQLGICLFHQHPDYQSGSTTSEFVAVRTNFIFTSLSISQTFTVHVCFVIRSFSFSPSSLCPSFYPSLFLVFVLVVVATLFVIDFAPFSVDITFTCSHRLTTTLRDQSF